jgi:hypothetical protein
MRPGHQEPGSAHPERRGSSMRQGLADLDPSPHRAGLAESEPSRSQDYTDLYTATIGS